jgi:phenylpropionate dioxygenase-like ring-hydroxylating dioxygenase large terminal subunit
MKRETVFEILDQVDYEFARSEPPDDFPDVPRIPAARYFDPDFFELEMDAIRRCWVIVGTVHEWPDNGSYQVIDRWGTASVIVVRGDDGELRAFYNTCQHRGAPITRDTCGRVNKLRCQWHSWQYALDGTLVNIPGRRDFRNDLDEDAVRLNGVRCEVWRGFVFVNLDPDAPDLVEWLGPVADQASWFDGLRTAARSEMVLDCNWKICIEANIEVYHVTTVHPTTVARGLDYRGSAHELYDTGHSRMVVPKLGYDATETRQAAEHGDAFDALKNNSNVSFLLFPFHLTPSGAAGMTLQTFWPLGVDKTLLEWWTMIPDWGEGDPPEWTQGRNDYFDKVMAEDTESNEPVQRSLQAGAFPGILTSYHERRIYHHEAAVDRLIGIDDVPEELRVPQLLDHYIVDRPGHDRPPDSTTDRASEAT